MEHTPVLQQEVLRILNPLPGQNFIDCTLGYAGHALKILEATSPGGKLLGIDQDREALSASEATLKKFGDRAQLENANFTELGLLVRKWPVNHIDGILIDLGPSTVQLTGERGFSFRNDAPLDMRMSPQSQRLTAADILNKSTEEELVQILSDGEEKFARQIARKIIQERNHVTIEKTSQLVEMIRQATPPSYRFGSKTHFATGTFRALRMKTNNELGNIQSVLPQAAQVLSIGGILAVITFHSLEDRIVKNFFRDSGNFEIMTSKPVIGTEQEITNNPSARSAKLRAGRKL